MARTLKPDWAELSQPGVMRTLDMVLDPEKTLEIEIARPSRPRTTVEFPAYRQRANAHRTIQMLIALIATMLVVMFATACASTGATFRSGVGDSFPDGPPYYAGVVGDTGAIGHAPITYQRGATQSAMFDPRDGAGTPVAALLADMNRFLDSVSWVPLASSAMQKNAALVPPDVRFGCETDTRLPDADCVDRDGALGRGRLPMHLAIGRPSPEWIEWNRKVMIDCGVTRSLIITLEVSQYLTRQRGWTGGKEVELGTNNVAKLPWLTSLETPVTVLQLTGAVVDRDGKAIRIGAEGFYVRRTRLGISAIGGQELLGDEDLVKARELRRDDLAGSPLAWRVALGNLVAGLTK
jgi:hypothetical protein